MIHNTSRVYSIALPTGAVTDLGAVPTPTLGCEGWAYWGVAEYFGGACTSTTCRADGGGADGGAVRRGDDAGDVLLAERHVLVHGVAVEQPWYWHHEGGSQFGGSDESIGYCNATFTVGGTGGSGTGLGDSCSAGVGMPPTGTVVCNVAQTGTA